MLARLTGPGPGRAGARTTRRRRVAALVASAVAPVVALAAAGDGGRPQDLGSYRDTVPGTAVTFDMVAVPGGSATVRGPDGAVMVEVGAFWIGRTEVTWDAYDVYAFQLDLSREERAAGVDAVTRPTRPYGAPDWGFGHEGFPAMSVTYQAAQRFCEWLSAKTGRRYRLPTDAEWSLAAARGLGGGELSPGELDALGWYGANSGGTTHPVATKQPDRLGVFDLVGNVAEWVAGEAGPVVRGGSYRDQPPAVGPEARGAQTPAWNVRDPQIPKSPWWLSDGPFVGFRLVREP